jgi:hypothetical protein
MVAPKIPEPLTTPTRGLASQDDRIPSRGGAGLGAERADGVAGPCGGGSDRSRVARRVLDQR